MKNLLLIGISIICFQGCTSEEGGGDLGLDAIKTSTTQPSDCEKLGTVTGATIREVSKTEAYKKSLTDIRRSTKSLGGNYLYIKRISEDSKFLSGIAYSCEKK